MPERSRSKPEWQVRIAKERIDILFGEDQGHGIAAQIHEAGKKDRNEVQCQAWRQEKTFLQALLLLFRCRRKEKAEKREDRDSLSRMQARDTAGLQELEKNQDETCVAVRLQ